MKNTQGVTARIAPTGFLQMSNYFFLTFLVSWLYMYMYQICDEWTTDLTDISYMCLVTLYPNLFRKTLYHQTSDKLRCSPQQQDFQTFSWFWKKKSKTSWLFPEMPDFLKNKGSLCRFRRIPDLIFWQSWKYPENFTPYIPTFAH